MHRNDLTLLLEAACLAPSVDNCQPWRFSCLDDLIHIFLDRERAEFFGDFGFAASYATIGAVIENLRIAASTMGLATTVNIFPSADTDHVASVSFLPQPIQPDSLHSFLSRRCTNRRKYGRQPLTSDQCTALQAAAAATPGATLHLIQERSHMKELFRLAAQVDSIIFDHPLLHANLFRWIRWNDSEVNRTQDGMPVGSLELDIFQRQFFRLISSFGLLKFLNLFGLNRLIGMLNSSLLLESSAIGLLVMDGTSDAQYLEGGRCMQRIWLTATEKGLAFQPFGGLPFLITRMLRGGDEGFSSNQYTLLQSIYAKLQELVPVTPHQGMIIMFRIGYASSPSAVSVRRPVDRVSCFKS